MSDPCARLDAERRRRDLTSAIAACTTFYFFPFFLSFMIDVSRTAEPAVPPEVRIKIISESELQIMFPEPAKSTIMAGAQRPIPKVGAQMETLERRETLVGRSAPDPLTSELPAPAELERRRSDPASWEADRTEMAEKTASAHGAVDLPKPVQEEVKSVADRKPEPIQRDMAVVEQKEGLNKTSADFPAARAQLVKSEGLARDVDAPGDVVREKLPAMPEIPADRDRRAPDAIEGVQEQRMAKKTLMKTDVPAAQVASAYTPAPNDMPEFVSAAPATWDGSRSQAVSEHHRVRAASVALPVVSSDRPGHSVDLSGKITPLEAQVADVQPRVELRRVVAAGPAGIAKPAASTQTVVVNSIDAPVELTNQAVRMDGPSASAPKVVGLQAAVTRPVRQGIADKDRPEELNQPSKDEPAPAVAPSAPATAPDKWTDAPGASDRRVLAEKASIDAGVVSLPTDVQEKTESLVSPRPDDLSGKTEAVSSKFEFLTLSEQPAPGASEAEDAGGGSGDRKLLLSPHPEIPEWYELRGIDSVGAFRIRISPDGNVESVDVETTTGSKDIDANWMSAIMNWKYDKGDGAATRLVKVRIQLRK